MKTHRSRILASAALLALAVSCAPPHPHPDVGIRAVDTDVVVGTIAPPAPTTTPAAAGGP